MKLVLASVGRMRSGAMAAVRSEYMKRLRRYTAAETLEIREVPGQSSNARAAEARAIGDVLRDRDYLVLCDEAGSMMTSRGLASFLADRERSGAVRTVFLVGGPFGVDGSVRDRADKLLSLSRLTLPHELAMVVLVEAIYRAFTILRGEKYHHA